MNAASATRNLRAVLALCAALSACEPATEPQDTGDEDGNGGCGDGCADAADTTAPDTRDTLDSFEAPDDGEDLRETTPDGEVPRRECGRAAMLADDFEALLPFDRWTTSGGVAAQARNSEGQATIGLGPVPGFGGYFARARVALWSSALRVEVTRIPDPASRAVTSLTLTNGENALGFTLLAGRLVARRVVDGLEEELAAVPYDATRHRWWQLREAGDETTWEVSRDGLSWQLLAAAPVAFDLTWLRTELAAGTSEVGTSPGTAAFDNLNGGQPSGRWCAVRDLRDTFVDEQLGEQWSSWRNPGCSIAPDGGGLVLRPVIGLTTSCGMSSARPIDMQDGELVIEVSGLVGPAGVVAKFGIESAGFFAGFSDDGPNLRLLLERDVDVRVVASLLPDPAEHRWWRLRAHAGILYWETSRDTLVWVTHAAEAANTPLDGVMVSTLIVQYQVNPEPREFRFDNLNTLP